MSGRVSSAGEVEKALKALERRAKAILRARPAYKQMVAFYLTVFRRQIEWSDRLVVQPEVIDQDQRRECLRAGQPLIERYDPGLESESLQDLWTEMKAVFGRGNDTLRQAVEKIDDAEEARVLSPATWLLEQRPDRCELLAETSTRIGIDESLLATLTRAVTFPHWKLVARSWLGDDRLDEWRRFHCPVCGGPPGLAEIRSESGTSEGITAAKQRRMHCPFCGAHWAVPELKCPACDSTRPGDAKYYYTAKEPELRIDFCKACKHYVKVVNVDKVSSRLHLGLELLTTAHLDAIAQDKRLRPLEVCS